MSTPTFPVTIGVDEIATETQECSGFTIFCLPDAFVPQFASDARAILSRYPDLHGFHGKKYKQGHEAAYRDFLTLIRRTTSQSLQAGASNVLLSRAAMSDLTQFADRVLTKALDGSGVPTEPALTILRPYAHRVLMLARELRELGPDISATLHIDDGEELKSLATVTHSVGTTPIKASVLLKAVYNGYAAAKHTNAPRLGDDAVNVMRDGKSFLIQAADVLGNFSMNHVFVKLGKASKKREAKARLIEEIYGDLIDPLDLSGAIALREEDLVLAPDQASLRFRLRWVETETPLEAPQGGTHGTNGHE